MGQAESHESEIGESVKELNDWNLIKQNANIIELRYKECVNYLLKRNSFNEYDLFRSEIIWKDWLFMENILNLYKLEEEVEFSKNIGIKMRKLHKVFLVKKNLRTCI